MRIVTDYDVAGNRYHVGGGSYRSKYRCKTCIRCDFYSTWILRTVVVPFYTGASYTTSNLTADTTFYVSVDGENYCENDTGARKAVTIIVKPYPEPDDITGKTVVCVGQEIELFNNFSGEGAWKKNNANISFSNPTANKVTVTGVTEGKSFVTYIAKDCVCETRVTFRVKVIPVPSTPPKIIIGIER